MKEGGWDLSGGYLTPIKSASAPAQADADDEQYAMEDISISHVIDVIPATGIQEAAIDRSDKGCYPTELVHG